MNQICLKNDKEELLQEIQSTGFRLNGQVENLLNMSRLESGSVDLHKDCTDVNELFLMNFFHFLRKIFSDLYRMLDAW